MCGKLPGAPIRRGNGSGSKPWWRYVKVPVCFRKLNYYTPLPLSKPLNTLFWQPDKNPPPRTAVLFAGRGSLRRPPQESVEHRGADLADLQESRYWASHFLPLCSSQESFCDSYLQIAKEVAHPFQRGLLFPPKENCLKSPFWLWVETELSLPYSSRLERRKRSGVHFKYPGFDP